MFTLVVVLLMALAAVVIDVGLLRTDTGKLQNALDAGALAAAQSLPVNKANVTTVSTVAPRLLADELPGHAQRERPRSLGEVRLPHRRRRRGPAARQRHAGGVQRVIRREQSAVAVHDRRVLGPL